MKTKYWIASILIIGLVVVSFATSIQANDSQVIVTETEDGVTFDFSANPIEAEVYLFSSCEAGEFEENMTFKKKKIIAGSCEGPGSCIINSSTAAYKLKNVVFDDGTIATF